MSNTMADHGTWILAATEEGNARLAISRISPNKMVAFLERAESTSGSWSIPVKA